jgi:putative membrane protein
VFEFAVRILFNAIAVIAAVRLVPGAAFEGDWLQLGILAAIFGIVNAYLRPIVKLLSLPLNLFSFGLIGFVINTGLVMIVAAISDNLGLGFRLGGWPPGAIDADVILAAFLVSLVVSAVSTLLALVRFSTPRI